MKALILLLGMTTAAHAGDFSASARGTTTAQFLKLGAGARGEAMGEAYTAVADGPEAIFWNPAGLLGGPERGAFFTHSPYIDSSYFDHIGYKQKLGAGVIGGGIEYFSAGSIDATDTTGTTTGSFTPSDMAVSVGYAQKVKDFSLGATAKYIQSKIATTATAMAIDLGVITPAYADGKLTGALAITNFGTTMKFDSAKENLPLAIRLGSAYKVQENWTAALDINFPRDNKAELALGTEYRYKIDERTKLAGRVGYNTRTSGDLSGLAGPAFGLGIGYDKYAFDYAIVPFGDLGLTHRITLSARF